MAIFDIKLPKSIARALNIPISNPRSQQIKVLKKLLKKARFTEFGQRYRFDDVLMSNHPGKSFSKMYQPSITIRYMMPGGIKQRTVARMYAGRGL